MVTILDIDSAMEIAKKIYERFEVLESCNVVGWGEHYLGKGEDVLNLLRLLDEQDHIIYNRGGKRQRENRYKANSIGGPIAHKIFTWERRIVNSEPRYTIWRIQ